ncbi:nucleoside phosphorylase domain-containing protein [Mariannaea sp. PMI_226]|nr:nucleoside phosphorylase domain-containing protein [Mariannaea sp. PMI_226]
MAAEIDPEIDPNRYTVGWIAPMAAELTLALGLLKDYKKMDIAGDDVTYHTGKIGHHYVVMVVCPRVGLSAATSAVTHMRRSFPKIEHILVVGIGGGVPSYGEMQEQIVLGDIVVGVPRGPDGGVKHYEFGAWKDTTKLTDSGHLLHPSRALLGAVNNLRALHARKSGCRIQEYISELREELIEEEREECEDPQARLEDRLFEHDYIHPDRDRLCEGLCDVTRSKLRTDRGKRAVRKTDSPRVHYGTIGSANSLVISSGKRDELHKVFGITCVEMESAGIMSENQGLVIRGISDYADSHKNKKWQKYAAATAAAYAKEVLLLMPAGNSGKRGEGFNLGG